MSPGRSRPAAAPAWLPVLARLALAVTGALCHIEVHGSLPRREGPLLILANHQHDLDSIVVPLLAVLTSPMRTPVRAAASQRLFEPGFLSPRLPEPLRHALPGICAGRGLTRLGALPIENEPLRRPLASLGWEVFQRHGDLALREVVTDGGPGRLSDLWSPERMPLRPAPASLLDLRPPHRAVVRAAVRPRLEAQMQACADALRRGETLMLTPEGRVSPDGRLGPMRDLLSRLLPVAGGRVHLAAIAYDPLLRRRLTMLVRLVPPADPGDLATSLAAARPVTASQLLSAWLVAERPAALTRPGIEAALRGGLRALPPGTWVAPSLRSPPGAAGHAWGAMLRLGYCARGGALTGRRHDRRLHEPPDVFAAQAAMLAETCAAVRRLAR